MPDLSLKIDIERPPVGVVKPVYLKLAIETAAAGREVITLIGGQTDALDLRDAIVKIRQAFKARDEIVGPPGDVASILTNVADALQANLIPLAVARRIELREQYLDALLDVRRQQLADLDTAIGTRTDALAIINMRAVLASLKEALENHHMALRTVLDEVDDTVADLRAARAIVDKHAEIARLEVERLALIAEIDAKRAELAALEDPA